MIIFLLNWIILYVGNHNKENNILIISHNAVCYRLRLIVHVISYWENKKK